jgi:hypothetical protein
MNNQHRTNRTMSDAFGPYAELYVEPDPILIRLGRYIWSLFK